MNNTVQEGWRLLPTIFIANYKDFPKNRHTNHEGSETDIKNLFYFHKWVTGYPNNIAAWTNRRKQKPYNTPNLMSGWNQWIIV